MDEKEEDESKDYAWEMNVRRVSNGFILSLHNEEGVLVQEVIEGAEDVDGVDTDMAIRLLHIIMHYFCLEGNRYDRRRVMVTTEKGSGYEGGEEEG